MEGGYSIDKIPSLRSYKSKIPVYTKRGGGALKVRGSDTSEARTEGNPV